MYVPPGPTNPIDVYGAGGAYVARGSGLGITDSAGLFARGTFGFKDTSGGGGGITGSYALSDLP
jgi:hypothetical protein